MYQQQTPKNQIPANMKTNPQIDKIKKIGRKSSLEMEETEVTDINKMANDVII
jgi:hypothetical protein